MSRVWLACLVATVGCASMPAQRTDLAALAEADLLVLRGCYDCLVDARATYERAATGLARPQVIERLFETHLLIAVREKELALDPLASIEAARALTEELPPGVDGPRYVAIAEAIPADSDGLTRRAREAFARAHEGFGEHASDEVEWLETAPLQTHVRRYLATALECAYLERPSVDLTQVTEQLPVEDTPPLVRFRQAICPGRLDESALERIRRGNARFVEASLLLSRFDIADAEEKGPGRGIERLREGYGRFPESPLVTYLLGTLHQLVVDCERGIGFFDETLALAPEHERAMLGRTVCLSLLDRVDDAIAAASELIALGDASTLAQAYYWRARNYYARRDLKSARRDIDQAKLRGQSLDISTLAGMIEHDQDDLDPAERDLTIARRPTGEHAGNCTAMWYLGLVHGRREHWERAAREFEDATVCYGVERRDNEEAIAALEAQEDLDAGYRARRIDLHAEVVRKDIARRHASALNAANCYARIGDRASASRFITIAAGDPGLAADVAELRAWLRRAE